MTEVIINSIVNIIWILYAIIDGISDGYYWHNAMSINEFDYKRFNLHPISVIKRGIVLIGLVIISQNYYLILPLLLTFSFCHNGAYYITRKNLSYGNIYKKGWFDQSTTSTSKWTFFNTPVVRTTLFIIGIISNLIYLLTIKN